MLTCSLLLRCALPSWRSLNMQSLRASRLSECRPRASADCKAQHVESFACHSVFTFQSFPCRQASAARAVSAEDKQMAKLHVQQISQQLHGLKTRLEVALQHNAALEPDLQLTADELCLNSALRYEQQNMANICCTRVCWLSKQHFQHGLRELVANLHCLL